MSDTYNCEYCGNIRHYLDGGCCSRCNSEPNFLDNLQNENKHLKDRIDSLSNKYKNKKEEDFESLYLAYWRYVYRYEVGYENDFEPDKPAYKRNDFKQQLEDEGMAIKVNGGY